ncbi:MAG: sugar phosphate isomerase/epimerase [Rhodocyclaceae bacterium]
MYIGYNQACTRDCSTLVKDLELCERVGFDFIEIRLDMLSDYLKTHHVDELKAFFRSSRLRPHALNALYLYPELFSARDDAGKRDALLAEFISGCQVAQAIGSEYFIVVPPLQRDPLGGPFIGNWPDTFDNCVRILSRLADLAAPYGVKLCFELVGFERSSVRTVAQANEIVTAVGRDDVGFVFDSYNLFLYDEEESFARMRDVDPKKIFAIHINNADDVPAPLRGQDKRRFCDSGVMDLGHFLRHVKATGYQGMVSIETFRPEYWHMAPEEVIRRAYETTRQCLLDYGCLAAGQ